MSQGCKTFGIILPIERMFCGAFAVRQSSDATKLIDLSNRFINIHKTRYCEHLVCSLCLYTNCILLCVIT
jgi:hypothetical protein